MFIVRNFLLLFRIDRDDHQFLICFRLDLIAWRWRAGEGPTHFIFSRKAAKVSHITGLFAGTHISHLKFQVINSVAARHAGKVFADLLPFNLNGRRPEKLVIR